MPPVDYDVIVVGAGMFGSSAAKHVRLLRPELRVCVVGPDTNDGPLARGQHFDEARICRRVETLVPWAHLNDLGALSYRATEAASGIDFYTPCGCVWVGTADDGAACVACLEAVQAASGGAGAVPYAVVREDGAAGAAAAAAAVAAGKTSVLRVTSSAAAAEAVFGGGIRVGQLGGGAAETRYVVESGPAGGGTVHPSRYVAAQLACAAAVAPSAHYAHVAAVVLSVVRVAADDGAAPVYAVTTDAGHSYHAHRVLVATASFTKYHKLLPECVTDRILPHPTFVVLVRVKPPHGDDHEANVKASEGFPSVICTAGQDHGHFYALPPRYYADRGGWYIKMGRSSGWLEAKKDADVADLAGAMEWYHTGASVPRTHETVQQLSARVSGLYPCWPAETNADFMENVEREDRADPRLEVVRCIFDETMNEEPLIDCVDGAGLSCAVGSCGRGAKTCDPIGCIAAHRMLGVEVPPEYQFAKDLFHVQRNDQA